MTKQLVFGPTFEEMLHPSKIDPAIRERALKAKDEDELDPINLYNITWRNPEGGIYYVVLPRELPTRSHKVGASLRATSSRASTRSCGRRPATTASAVRTWGRGWGSTLWCFCRSS